MICYTPGNTSDVEGGNKFDDLNKSHQQKMQEN